MFCLLEFILHPACWNSFYTPFSNSTPPSVAFYASGYTSVDEAVSATKIWASSWRERFENWLGMEDRPSKTHPEVLATKHMNEEEELKYIYDKYIKEPEERQQDSPPNESK